jgi:ribulose-bisphosphate carboxylase large chain
MAYGGYSYLESDYKPGKDDFVVLIWAKGTVNINNLAEGIAAESSVGTFTKIKTMNEKIFKHYRAHVFEIMKTSEDSGFIKIAYPLEHFDQKNVVQFCASVMGNIYGLLEIEELYIMDISFPEKYQKLFKGPIGLEAIRRYVGTDKNRRPHCGTIVKPKVGLTPTEFADVAYKVLANGLDLVKDDENLVDQDFCKWRERVDLVNKAMNKAELETGEKKLYCCNVSDSSIDRMEKRLDYLHNHGLKMVMLDVFVLGMPATMHMVNLAHRYRMFTHAHRAGYAAVHRGGDGYSFGILEKFYRMIGLDQIHVGTGVGKMDGAPHTIRRFARIARDNEIKASIAEGGLEISKFDKSIASVMPVASGGLHAGLTEGLFEIFGNDFTMQAGGGVHGHPRGSEAGAKALRAAADAIGEGITLEEKAKTSKELNEGLKKFGYVKGYKVKRMLNFFDENVDLFEMIVKKQGMSAIRMFDKTFDARGNPSEHHIISKKA